MKMEKINSYASDFTVPLPTAIGREFVRQYYTKWSMNPNEVFQFYGNESNFLRGETEANGQEVRLHILHSTKELFLHLLNFYRKYKKLLKNWNTIIARRVFIRLRAFMD